MNRKEKWFFNFNKDVIFIESDKKFPSGFGVDAKNVGSALDDVLCYMQKHNIRIIPELYELKQYLRLKGNSLREQGNDKYWNTNSKKKCDCCDTTGWKNKLKESGGLICGRCGGEL